MKNKTLIILCVILCALALYSLYLDISAGDTGLNLLKAPALMVIGICQILRCVYTEKQELTMPSDITEQEDYILAKNRVNFGTKFGIAGILMIALPVAALFIRKGLHGIWAQMGLYSFLFGVTAAVIGLILFMLGSTYMAKAESRYRQEQSVPVEPENKIPRICGIVSAIAWAVVLAEILISM
ncbi:MAG: hypothetical protein IKU09_05700 [Firmicutes bacterium]|nr:hypothetical protein [Bacillota bacterium]